MTQHASPCTVDCYGGVVVLIAAVVSLGMGASAVAAGRRAVLSAGALRAPGLWATIFLQVLIVAPACAYMLMQEPQWALMYLGESTEGEALAPLCLVPLVAALLGYVGAWRLLLKSGAKGVWALTAGGVALTAAVAVFGQRQLASLGTSEAFRANEPMMPLIQTRFGAATVAAVVVFALLWLWTLWRLHVYDRASRHQTEQMADTQLRAQALAKLPGAKAGGTMQLEDAKPSKKRQRRRAKG